MALPPQAKERIVGGLWSAAWMWPLISPVIALAQGKVRNEAWAATGLIAFVGFYVVVVTNGFDVNRHRARTRPTPGDVVLLSAVAAIGLALFAAYADSPDGWAPIILYVSVAGAATFGPKLAGVWTLAFVGITIGWAMTAHNGADAFGGAYALVLGMLMAGALVQVVRQMQRYIQILRNTRAELAQTAVSEERLRFARDLHDLLGHTMSLIVVKAEVVRRLVDRDPALAAQAAADIETIGRRALSEVRQAVDGYRAPDFSAALDGARSALADAGIAVRVRHDGPPVPQRVSQTFGWVIREAATNVIRHSGAAATTVTVTVADDEAVLHIRDDGRGRRVSDGRVGAGLTGLTERVTAAGGTLVFGNAPGSGFQIIATMPARALDTCPDAADPLAAAGTASAEDAAAAQDATAAARTPVASGTPSSATAGAVLSGAASSPASTEASA